MLGFRGWQRLLALSIFGLFTVYTILLYSRPSWLPAPPRPWDDDAIQSTKPGSSGGGSGSGSGSIVKPKPGDFGSAYDDIGSTTPDSFTIPDTDTSAADGSDSMNHPIERLIYEGRVQFKALLGKRSLTLDQAAARYRERRQRHPPPGFDAWFAAAKESNAVVVEEFFDRIYADLAPLWAFKPSTLRMQTHMQPQVIRVRQGKASYETDNEGRPPWIQHWTTLVQEISEHLPDLDMVVNVMDETRLLVPWSKIREYVEKEQELRRRPMARPRDTISKYSGLADVEAAKVAYKHSWITNDANKFWDHLQAACPPDSPARKKTALSSFAGPVEYPSTPNTAYTQDGYVSNATAARDPCLQPHLRGMHGTFIESVSMSTSHELMPMFAGCKLPQNNEILIPGAMYLTEDPFYSGGQTHGVAWADKKPAMVWRGTASGGRNKGDNWWHFHRHRWVEMANGTTVAAVEKQRGRLSTKKTGGSSDGQGGLAAGPTFQLPEAAADVYGVEAQQSGRLGKWVSQFSDVGFVDLECFPLQHDVNGTKELTCSYTSPYMAVLDGLPMSEQYDYKFLPDVDGNSYSARWRSFLRSTSMPLKATIYAEWHDDRLVPWVHYAPFDSSYMDLYAVMDYFLAHGARGDAAAQRIADEGRLWAEAVLRREDMQLYVWRLLLEYARVVDDQRDRLAFVKDLTG